MTESGIYARADRYAAYLSWLYTSSPITVVPGSINVELRMYSFLVMSTISDCVLRATADVSRDIQGSIEILPRL